MDELAFELLTPSYEHNALDKALESSDCRNVLVSKLSDDKLKKLPLILHKVIKVKPKT